jgi:hypothetical protein
MITLAIYAAVALLWAGVLFWGIRRHVKAGHGATDAFRESIAVVEVELDEPGAEALCKRALLEVNDTRTTRKFKKRRLHVLSHLDKNPGNLGVSFRLEPLDGERTRVRVSLYPRNGQLALDLTERREALTERLGSWLAEHGNGRVLESGYGSLGAWGA